MHCIWRIFSATRWGKFFIFNPADAMCGYAEKNQKQT
jgi:hypothetical protein